METETVCRDKAVALSLLGAICEHTRAGAKLAALRSVMDWIQKTVNEIPDDRDFNIVILPPGSDCMLRKKETKQRIQKIFEGSEFEQKGMAWLNQEMNDHRYVPGALASDGCHCSHAMINEPQDGAELACFWNAGKQAWEPIGYYWPPVLPRQDFEPEGESPES